MLEGLVIRNTAWFLHRYTDTSTQSGEHRATGRASGSLIYDVLLQTRSTVPPTTEQTICASAGCSTAKGCTVPSSKRPTPGWFLPLTAPRTSYIRAKMCNLSRSAPGCGLGTRGGSGGTPASFRVVVVRTYQAFFTPHFHARARAHTHPLPLPTLPP